uniref:Uncharacterized protein n=1 Tax=Romanomermis culicivorax TaxID=13658 RepID=A0A915JVE2_ROMCU
MVSESITAGWMGVDSSIGARAMVEILSSNAARVSGFIGWAWRSSKSLTEAYSSAEHGEAKRAANSIKEKWESCILEKRESRSRIANLYIGETGKVILEKRESSMIQSVKLLFMAEALSGW